MVQVYTLNLVDPPDLHPQVSGYLYSLGFFCMIMDPAVSNSHLYDLFSLSNMSYCLTTLLTLLMCCKKKCELYEYVLGLMQ